VQPVLMADLAAQHARLAPKIDAAVGRVLKSGRYIGGPTVAELESSAGQLFGLAHTVGVNSGTDALILSLQAMGIGPGARVAIPALSFFATAEAVIAVGATPIFIDVLADRPVMNPERLADTACDAAILVHLFGALCPPPIGSIRFLSDAAQCAGWGHGTPAGEVAAVSFYPTKTWGAAGDAGAVLSNDKKLIDDVRAIANHGQRVGKTHEQIQGIIGSNSRIDAIQAAILLVHLEDLPRRITQRKTHAARYEDVLGQLALPRHPHDAVHQFVFRHPDRDRLANALNEDGIQTAIYYARPMYKEPAIQSPESESYCPEAEQFCRENLAIPCHSHLHPEQVDWICARLKALL